MLTDKEKAVAILMLYAAKGMSPKDAKKACSEIGIGSPTIIQSVKDLEQFRLELGS
jgi:hypothetical protein